MRDLVDSILSCSAAPQNWDAALDAFNDTFDISACCMFSVHEFRETRMNFAWSAFHRDNLPPGAIEAMQRGDDAGDQAGYRFLYANPAQTLYDEMTIYNVNRYDDLPRSNVRDITEGMGLTMRVAAALNTRGPWLDGLFCQHLERDDWQGFVASANAALVLPIMANSVSLGRVLQALRSQYRTALSVLDAFGLAVFLVDQTGAVIDHNAEAQRILDDSDGISLDAFRNMRLGKPETNAELNTMIDTANGLLRGDFGTAATLMASERPSGAFDYLISVRALNDSTAELERGLQCAFVTVIDPAQSDQLSADGLSVLGQLSEAETAVVDLLIQGYRPAEVAAQRDVSLNTVKSQLRVISQKLRCSTQADIIRVAAATRLPIKKPAHHPNG